jgi:hypothetical protein
LSLAWPSCYAASRIAAFRDRGDDLPDAALLDRVEVVLSMRRDLETLRCLD